MEEVNFPISAREGQPFPSTTEGEVTIGQVASLLKSGGESEQKEGLSLLGISLEGQRLKYTFRETGKKYTSPKFDRTLIEAIPSTLTIRDSVILPTAAPNPLVLKMEMEPFTQDGVNFAGRLIFATPTGEERLIPLTGRGTIALEGRAKDAHAGFCTGAACATFQNRAALLLGVSAAAGASPAILKNISEDLVRVNEHYHGRLDALDYALECASLPSSGCRSYLDFMTRRYADKPEEITALPVLESVQTTGLPHEGYYVKAREKMTREELEEDCLRFQGGWRDTRWLIFGAIFATVLGASTFYYLKNKN